MTLITQPADRGIQRTFDWLTLVPAVVGGVLFAAGNDNFGFDPPGWLDPFVYVGYFWHYSEHLPIFDGDYKASRLPWVLPGFLAHRLLGEVAASYALHWATLTGGGLAMYLLLRDSLGNRVVATVVGVAWVCSTGAHGVGGWNYHMLAAAGYYLCACWLVVRMGLAPSSTRFAAAAGAMFACAVHSHLFFLVFAPLLVPLYFILLPAADRRWSRMTSHAGWMLSGAVAITALLAAINASTGGAWLFFIPQVRYTLWISEPGNNEWWLESAMWLGAAKYLVVPLLCLAGGTAALLRRIGHAVAVRRVFVLQAWLALAVCGYYQFLARQSVLDHDYMAFAIYCHTFPALAVAMLRARDHDSKRVATAGLIVSSVALILGALLLGTPAWMSDRANELAAQIASSSPPLSTLLAVGFIGLMGAALLPDRAAVLGLAAWFAVMNAAVTFKPDTYGIGTPGVQRSMMMLFREADRFTTALDPSLNGIEYWFLSEPVPTSQGIVDLADVFDSYVSTRVWFSNLLLTRSPGVSLQQLQVDDLEEVTCIGVLSSVERHDAVRLAWANHFASSTRPLRHVVTRQYVSGDLAFALTVFKPRPLHAEAVPRVGPPCLPTSS